MVRGLLLAARPAVDSSGANAVDRFRRAEEMVDAEAGVPLPAAGGIIPEGVELVVERVRARLAETE